MITPENRKYSNRKLFVNQFSYQNTHTHIFIQLNIQVDKK